MRSKLIIIVTALVLIITSFLLFKLSISSKEEVFERFRAGKIATSREVVKGIKIFFNEKVQGLKLLSSYPSLQNSDVKQITIDISKFFDYSSTNNIKSISVYNEIGTIIYSVNKNAVGRNYSQSDFLKWAVKKENMGNQFVSQLTKTPNDPKTNLSNSQFLLVSPIYRIVKYPTLTYKYVGAITFTINMEELLSTVYPIDSYNTKNEHVMILDGNETVLFHSEHPEMILKNIRQQDETCLQCHTSFKHVETILTKKEGTTEYILKEGPKKLASFSSFEFRNISWTVAITIPIEEAEGFFDKNLSLILILVGILVFTLIGGSFLIYFFNNRLKIQAQEEAKYWKDKRGLGDQIRESELRFRSVWEKSTDGMRLTNGEGIVRLVNDAYCKMMEKPREEIEGKPISILYEAAKQAEILRKHQERFHSRSIPAHLERELVLWNGKRIVLELSNTFLENPHQPTLSLSVFKNITERKRAEEEIVSQKNRFAQLFENSPIAIALLDDQDKVVHINESFSVLFGYFFEEIKGQLLHDIIVPAEFIEEAKSYSDQTREGNQINKESYRKKKDGTLVYVQIVGVPVTVNDKTVGIYGMYVDLTQRKDVEEKMKSAKELAEQSDKMKTEFLAQMSHEIRTPINIITSNVNFISEELGDKIDPADQDCFESIDLASRRIIRTVDLILNMSELQTGIYKPSLSKVDIESQVLKKLYNEFQRMAKQKGIDFIYKCEVKESEIICDEYCVTQIFANLIDNAVKYTKKGKVEILLTKNKDGNIVAEVKDTGIGMSKEFLPHLFEPFVQEEQGYSRSYEGNGLGLALVKRYCDINNAVIEVESEKNVGSTFRVIFK